MKRLLLAAGILAVPVVLFGISFLQQNNPEPRRDQGLYAADPNHIWNRLHRHLYERTGADGQQSGAERLDPLLWRESRHLRDGPSYEKAVALANEFLAAGASLQISDVRKRALFQRDAAAIFDYAAGHPGEGVPVFELGSAVARVMKSVALTSAEISALPNNYAEAVASQAYAAQYDPARPQQPFLPRDLFDENGPWVSLGDGDGGPVADIHTHEFGARSAFLVFMRLPEGRQSTLAYLDKLKSAARDGIPIRRTERLTHPPPQFPAGTQLALARRMFLIDRDGQLHATPIVESVQLRVFRAVPRDARQGFLPEPARAQQAVLEFLLDRRRFFAGQAGGLRAVSAGESDFSTFMTHGIDPFESAGRAGAPEIAKWRVPVLAQCAVCHSGPGVLSMMTPLRQIQPSTPQTEAEMVLYGKRQRFEWGLLQGYWHTAR